MKASVRGWIVWPLVSSALAAAAAAQTSSCGSVDANSGAAAVCAEPAPVSVHRAGGARAAHVVTRQDFIVGVIDADHDDSYVYRLPYGDGASYPVIQSYGSRFSHRGAEHFTVDFQMDEGTPVHAAREGIVALVEDGHEGGCTHAECGALSNFVVILHADGTTGEYFHLARGSSVVAVGQRVARGQMIARSGNTGFTTVPHLHFGVYRADKSGVTRAIAVQFETSGGAITAPRVGARYLNAPDRRFRLP